MKYICNICGKPIYHTTMFGWLHVGGSELTRNECMWTYTQAECLKEFKYEDYFNHLCGIEIPELYPYRQVVIHFGDGTPS